MKHILILFLLSPIFIFGQPLSNLQRGTARDQIPVTNGVFNTQVYRDAIPYILDTLGVRDSLNYCPFIFNCDKGGPFEECDTEGAKCGDFAYHENQLYVYDGVDWVLLIENQRIFRLADYISKDSIPDPRKYDIYVDDDYQMSYYYDGTDWQLFSADNDPFNEGEVSYQNIGVDSVGLRYSQNFLKLHRYLGLWGVNISSNEIDRITWAVDSTQVATKYDLTLITSTPDSIYIQSDTIRLRDGSGFVNLTPYVNTDSQALTIDSSGRIFNLSISGGNTVAWKDSVGITGAGAANKLAIWNSASTLTLNNNLGYTSGGNFHVGTTSGAYRVTSVAEDYAAYIGNAASTRGLWVVPESSNPWTVEVLGNTKLSGTILNSSGSAGSSGQVLTSQGSGNWTWTTPTTGTVTSVGLTTGTSGTDVNVTGSPVTGAGSFTLNIPTASASNRGALSAANWTTFNNKLGSLNGLTAATQTFAKTTSGNDFTITSSGSAHTFNLPFDGNAVGIRLGYLAGLVTNGVSLGVEAGRNLTGVNNISIGQRALKGAVGSTGTNNVGIGVDALAALTSGINNVAIGSFALASNTTGEYNFALGEQALVFNVSGSNNVAMGRWALRSSTGIGNMGLGDYSFRSTNGNYNVGVGAGSGEYNTGSNNTFIGISSGAFSGSASNCVYIGKDAGLSFNQSNSLIIDNQSTIFPLLWGKFDTDRLGINKNVTGSLNSTLHVGGDLTVDTRTGTAATVAGWTSAGVATAATVGTGLSLSSGTLTNVGVTSVNGNTGAVTVATLSGGQSPRMAYWTSASTLSNTAGMNWDNSNGRLSIGWVGTPPDQLSLTGNINVQTRSNSNPSFIAGWTNSNQASNISWGDGLIMNGTVLQRFTPNAILWNESDYTTTITSSYAKIDFAFNENSGQTTSSIANDQIQMLSTAGPGIYEINYNVCHDIPFNTVIDYAVFLNGSIIPRSVTTIECQNGQRNCFGKSFILSLTPTSTLDLRVKGTSTLAGSVIGTPILTVKKINSSI